VHLSRHLLVLAAFMTTKCGLFAQAQPPANVQRAQEAEQRVLRLLHARASRFDQELKQLLSENLRNKHVSMLTAQIKALEQACDLTPSQLKKLELCGRGDIVRFVAKCEAARPSLDSDDPIKLQDAVANADFLVRSAGLLFHCDSLLHKAIPNTLSRDQLAKYRAHMNEQRQESHQDGIKNLLAVLENARSLRESERKKLLDILEKIKPSRTPGLGSNYYYLADQVTRLPHEEYRLHLQDEHLRILELLADSYRTQLEPVILKAGIRLSDDDDQLNQ
jgi:hypothetical protein